MKISRWNKNCQVWKLDEEVTLSTPLRGYSYESDYVVLGEDGTLTIKAEYSWNGCSPKVEAMGMLMGTPEGALPGDGEKEKIEGKLKDIGYEQFQWRKARTHYASLVHDALYQIGEKYPDIDRKVVDMLFLKILKAYRFLPARAYYSIVRLLGRKFWGPGKADIE